MHGKSILVIDGSEPIRRSLESLVQGHGFQVFSAANADEALRQARVRTPHAILMGTRALGPGSLANGSSLADDPAFANVPLVEAERIHDVHREIQDGWQRRGAASKALMARLERQLRNPWSDGDSGLHEARLETASLSGELSRFPLADVLETVASSQLTGRLAVTGPAVSGAIFVEEGSLVGARLEEPFPCDEIREALDILLSLSAGHFALFDEETPHEYEDEPPLPVMSLLLERAQSQDEPAAQSVDAAGIEPLST